MFGVDPPEFEIRSISFPDFVFKMGVGDAAEAGLLKGGRLEIAVAYTYTNGEMIVLVAHR